MTMRKKYGFLTGLLIILLFSAALWGTMVLLHKSNKVQNIGIVGGIGYEQDALSLSVPVANAPVEKSMPVFTPTVSTPTTSTTPITYNTETMPISSFQSKSRTHSYGIMPYSYSVPTSNTGQGARFSYSVGQQTSGVSVTMPVCNFLALSSAKTLSEQTSPTMAQEPELASVANAPRFAPGPPTPTILPPEHQLPIGGAEVLLVLAGLYLVGISKRKKV